MDYLSILPNEIIFIIFFNLKDYKSKYNFTLCSKKNYNLNYNNMLKEFTKKHYCNFYKTMYLVYDYYYYDINQRICLFNKYELFTNLSEITYITFNPFMSNFIKKEMDLKIKNFSKKCKVASSRKEVIKCYFNEINTFYDKKYRM